MYSLPLYCTSALRTLSSKVSTNRGQLLGSPVCCWGAQSVVGEPSYREASRLHRRRVVAVERKEERPLSVAVHLGVVAQWRSGARTRWRETTTSFNNLKEHCVVSFALLSNFETGWCFQAPSDDQACTVPGTVPPWRQRRYRTESH